MSTLNRQDIYDAIPNGVVDSVEMAIVLVKTGEKHIRPKIQPSDSTKLTSLRKRLPRKLTKKIPNHVRYVYDRIIFRRFFTLLRN